MTSSAIVIQSRHFESVERKSVVMITKIVILFVIVATYMVASAPTQLNYEECKAHYDV